MLNIVIKVIDIIDISREREQERVFIDIFSTVMAPGKNALNYCICCKQIVTRKVELAHRRTMFSNPYASARPESAHKPRINLNSVFQSADLSSKPHSTPTGTEINGDELMADDFMDINSEDAIEDTQDTRMPDFPSVHVRSAFAARVEGVDDTGDDDIDEIPLEDPEERGDETSDSDGVVDWERLEVELVSMDMSGEAYAVHAAEVGVFPYFPIFNCYWLE